MLTRLAISGYRSLRDLRVDLEPLTVVTGANGSGKSSLYRALRLLADVAQGRIIRRPGLGPIDRASDAEDKIDMVGATSRFLRGLTMEDVVSLTGGCACGGVRYDLRGEAVHACLCHCVDCRRATGSPVVAWFSIGRSGFHVTSGAMRYFASSPKVQRASARTAEHR